MDNPVDNYLTELGQPCNMWAMSNALEHGDIPELTLPWKLQISLKHAKLKPGQMALLLGKSRQTMTTWLAGQRKEGDTWVEARPPDAVLRNWARITGVALSWLAPGVPEEHELLEDLRKPGSHEPTPPRPKGPRGTRKSPRRAPPKSHRSGLLLAPTVSGEEEDLSFAQPQAA